MRWLNKDIFNNTFWRNLSLILLSLSFYFVVLNARTILERLAWVFSLFEPFVWGFVFAFLLNGLMMFWEKKTFLSKWRESARRRLWSVLLTFATALGMITILFIFLLPQVGNSLRLLAQRIPEYGQNLENYLSSWFPVNSTAQNNLISSPDAEVAESTEDQAEVLVNDLAATEPVYQFNFDQLLSSVVGYLGQGLPALFALSGRVASSMFNAFVGLVIAVYLLYNKENYLRQARRVARAFLADSLVERISDILRYGNQTFTTFFYSKLLDSLLVGIICFIGMVLMGLPYALLISVIIGITNIIPFFGPFIGAIPATVLILAVNPLQVVWFVIFILILQQFDGNVMGPKIMANSIGLPAIWVMFAILIGGGMFGFVGMILGIPVFAMIYNLFREFVNDSLVEKSSA